MEAGRRRRGDACHRSGGRLPPVGRADAIFDGRSGGDFGTRSVGDIRSKSEPVGDPG
jgi:hypothetical protein